MDSRRGRRLQFRMRTTPRRTCCADVAQLVEHHLAKVRVAGSNPVVRSEATSTSWTRASTVEWPRGEAAACKAVYTGSNPVSTSQQQYPARPRAIGAAGARFPDTEEVTGSIPVSPTSITAGQRPFRTGPGRPSACAGRLADVGNDTLSERREPPQADRRTGTAAPAGRSRAEVAVPASDPARRPASAGRRRRLHAHRLGIHPRKVRRTVRNGSAARARTPSVRLRAMHAADAGCGWTADLEQPNYRRRKPLGPSHAHVPVTAELGLADVLDSGCRARGRLHQWLVVVARRADRDVMSCRWRASAVLSGSATSLLAVQPAGPPGGPGPDGLCP